MLRTNGDCPLFAPRRGVVLLMVLALLALFGLIAVAFVVISGHAQQNAKSLERIEQGSPAPAADAKKLLQQAAMQVLRGPNTTAAGMPNPASVMGAHSLLETMYGNGGTTGTIATAQAAGGTFPQLLNLTTTNLTLAQVAHYGGCVLTITGPSTTTTEYGQSTRIVGGNLSSTPPVIQVMAFSDGQVPPPGATFLINGVPFSGTGLGYNAATGSLNATITIPGAAGPLTCPLALLPNDTTVNRNPPGGANSDYTAADFQHMLLAAQVPNPAAPGGIQTLPSLHRSALCRYWANTTISPPPDLNNVDPNTRLAAVIAAAQQLDQTLAGLKLDIALRPLPDYHPNFTGSNPAYLPVDQTVPTNRYVTGFNPLWDGQDTFGKTPAPFSWDVDNDGDGVPDSVWVDLGMPVRSTADGRRYKPLFAILCLDLDGRLNLNAHGSLAQTDTADYSGPPVFAATGAAAQFAGGVAPTVRGQGLGPAEINLGALPNLTPALYQQLMTGGTTAYQGRYGANGVLLNGSVNLVYLNKWFEYAGVQTATPWWGFFTSPATYVSDSYGSPPDVFGAGTVGLDQAGRPLYAGMNYNGTNYVGFGSVLQNSPYQLNLGANLPRGLPTNPADNPFSFAEFERIARPYDRDAPSLPARLAVLTSSDPGGDPTKSVLIANRLAVTTESEDLPVPGVPTPAVAAQAQTPANTRIADLLMARLTAVGSPLTQAQALALLPTLLPPEVLAGLKMNLNRPFGNGRDYGASPGDEPATAGVVDAPVPPNAAKQVPLASSLTATVSVPVSYDGTAVPGTAGLATDPLTARQLQARYLYVMMCMTCDLQYLQTQLGSTDNVARFLAQWAINAVDFRDRDSIMTPFDYDPTFANPTATITGWNAVAGTAPRVWGCKRPELLISETLAFHDRRTDDTDQEVVDPSEGDGQTVPSKTALNGGNPSTGSPDASFDQVYRPQGSLFVELYNPSSPLEPHSGDLYSAPNGQLVLTKVTPAAAGNVSPVWRMVIAVPIGGPPSRSNEQPDPDDPVPGNPAPNYEREVYFVNPTATNATLPPPQVSTQGASAVQFYPSQTLANNVTVAPGGYAVIGPGETTPTTGIADAKRTYIGFATSGAGKGDPQAGRYIDLDPNTNMGYLVHNNTNTLPEPTNVAPVQTLAVDTPLRLSVSEPVAGAVPGYAQFETSGGPDSTTGKYAKPYDIPFDSPLKRPTDGGAQFQKNMTVSRYRLIYLQRLANPLIPYNNTPTDPNYNPYRTIDQMAVDVTAFNGVSSLPDPQATPPGTSTTHFQSRQRGECNDLAGAMNLWKQEPMIKTYSSDAPSLGNDSKTRVAIPQQYFQNGLQHSLGYLNQPFGPPAATPYPGDPSLQNANGNPLPPFPWLTWNNRPWVNPLELLLVPVLRSSKLLVNAGQLPTDPAYSDYFRFVEGGAAMSPYWPAGVISQNPLGLFFTDVPYPHLLNFFQSDKPGASGTSPQFHRILEYLRVPSPFQGTETWANPNLASGNAGAHAYHPPFNRIPTFREPGRINLNTITPQAFAGLMNGIATPTWATFVQSRRANDGNTNVLGMPAATCPTEFPRPFRSFGGAALQQPLPILQPDREINGTLLRADPVTPTQPLFQSPPSTLPAGDTNRNPYFRYQALQRLSNLVTTRSNVYAVWITVGYFEVTPVAASPIYPDGYTLGRELGMDTGEIERHRAFYIFDRTIPVGFQRGQDLNVEKAILVNRFIE